MDNHGFCSAQSTESLGTGDSRDVLNELCHLEVRLDVQLPILSGAIDQVPVDGSSEDALDEVFGPEEGLGELTTDAVRYNQPSPYRWEFGRCVERGVLS